MLSNEPIFRIHAELADILHLGATPYGDRRVINILGGRVEGKRLSGRILAGGADRQIVRPDGVADLCARYTIESDGGARILVGRDGPRHRAPEIIARASGGGAVDPALYSFRTAMRFETSDPEAAWLNRIIALARGAREPRAV